MQKRIRLIVATAVAAVLSIVVAACGSSSSSGPNAAGKEGGTITIASGTAPQSADQGLDFSTQGTELTSVVNTPLLTFVRGVEGAAGSKIIPALARSMPTVSNGGLTYTFYLRKGLHYSNGKSIVASDVTRALERDLVIPWQVASFVGANIRGANAYASHQSKTIAGVVTNDATGQIVLHLTHPFAPIIDIFALPGTAPVPPGTAMRNLASTGTIGDGQYKWGPISPGHTYTLLKNTKFDVPGIPRGHVDKIVYNVNPNVLANAESVLRNQADVFDPGDTLPASILNQVETQARDRYQPVPTNSSYYWFFAVNKKPFNNIYARQAVQAALDARALSRLDSGFIKEDCHLIPFGIIGHSDPSNCPFHNPAAAPNMKLAKQLMKKSGMIGQPVTVWGEERSPRRQWLDYYTNVLNSLGFHATEKVITSDVYFTTIGAPSTKAQTGFGDWVQDFPVPWDFMQLFTCTAGSTLNYGYVCDKHYDSQVNSLVAKPPEQVASQWAALDQYAVGKAYFAAFGHQEFPKFYSDRLVFSKGVLSVEYQTDLTSLQLKK